MNITIPIMINKIFIAFISPPQAEIQSKILVNKSFVLTFLETTIIVQNKE